MTKKFVLFEHALGYALLRVKTSSVDTMVELANSLLNDQDEFCRNFKLHCFVPFTSSAGALENCNAISEGVVPDDLKDFLMDNLSTDKSAVLYVGERKLADALKAPQTGLPENITCSTESALSEVYRAIRLHFPVYIKELSHFSESTAQVGLGHSYSRAKVKFNVHRNDNMIIQSINLLDQLDKDVNLFCMRMKEWFSYHFPELRKVVPDNIDYVKVVGLIGTREGATEDKLEELEALTNAETAQAIVTTAKSSFGFDITEEDAESVGSFTNKIVALVERRKKLQSYLASKLEGVAPNLSGLIGERVSARLISHAGSLMNLAKFPASTIQILGAEKALFRALKYRGRTPKYGLIFHSPFISQAAPQNKGRISRFLAAKCAIATRVDCFSEDLCDVYGRHLRKQVEDRLKFLETGEVPMTNAQAMAKAVAEANKYIRKMKKKSINTLINQEIKRMSSASSDEEVPAVQTNSAKSRKNKKKKQQQQQNSLTDLHSTSVDVNETQEESVVVGKKQKKKRNHSESNHTPNGSATLSFAAESLSGRRRTLSESSLLSNDLNQSVSEDVNQIVSGKKKKKKQHHLSSDALNQLMALDVPVSPSPKKAKKRMASESQVEPELDVSGATTPSKKKKKKHLE